jgi:hypothetical protein
MAQNKINLHLWVYNDNKFVSSYCTKNSATEDWIKERLNDWFGITGWTHYIKQGETNV